MKLSCHKSEEFFMALSSSPTLLPFLAIYYSAVNQLGSSSSLCDTRIYGKCSSLAPLRLQVCMCSLTRI